MVTFARKVGGASSDSLWVGYCPAGKGMDEASRSEQKPHSGTDLKKTKEDRDNDTTTKDETDVEAAWKERRSEITAENVEIQMTVKTELEGAESKKGENSEVAQEKGTKGKQGTGKKDSSTRKERDQIPLATQTAVYSDAKVFHSSVLSNTDNDSVSTTDREKSKGTSVPQTSRPEITEVGCSQVEGREKKRPSTDPNYVQKRSNKPKRRFRQSSETGASAQKLRKRSSEVEKSSGQRVSMEKGAVGGKKVLEAIILSVFQNSDCESTGFVKPSTFWKVLQTTLALQNDEVTVLQETILPDRSGLIPYMEFAKQAMEIIATLHVNQPPAERHWVELQMHDESLHINYNKQTGEAMDKTQTGNDFLANVIEDLYRQADKDGKGYINWEMFLQLLQSAEMSPYLQEQDLQDMYEYYANFEDERASYSEFVTLAKEMILRVYRAKYPSESPWYKISSPEAGEVWFNKFTGETYHGVPSGDREQEIAFISQAYAQVEQTNFELEQYKELNQQLYNQLAKTTEEQEMLEAQLYETGHALDQANTEIIEKENEVERMKGIIASKDQQIKVLKQDMSELDSTRMCLLEAEQELQNTREVIAKREDSITERDQKLEAMQQKAETVADTLKDAHGKIDAKDSAIEKLDHQLHMEQNKLKDYEEKKLELEAKLSCNNEHLSTTRHLLKEKTTILLQSRKHLRIAREKNMDMDKEMEKLELTQEKLRSMDSEIRSLKTFLTTKTVLIEKQKKEMQDEKLLVAELEEKDQRRAVILADVLERTARQYQLQIGWSVHHKRLYLSGKRYITEPQAGVKYQRPYSAPVIPSKKAWVAMDPPRPVISHSKAVMPSHPDQHMVRFREIQGGKTKTRDKFTQQVHLSNELPKLPRIIEARKRKHRTKTFVFPTNHDLKREQRLRDATLLDHTPSNPHCACKLCRMNATVNGQVGQHISETHPTGGLAKTAGLQLHDGEVDVQELTLSQQLQIGQRVVVRMKKSEFDLVPTKLTGVLRYVGKIDSEYMDHRLYVGVQLDEAVGDMGGLIKNKRYFTCPPKHGKLVRISNVVAVLPTKERFYKSLQDITKRNPYTPAHTKLSSIKVA